MRLKKVFIKNFRSIKEAELDFSENPRVLVGMNESGKTNILHALRLIDDQFPIQTQDIRETSLDRDTIDKAYIEFLFELEEEEIYEIYQEIKREILIINEESKVFKKGRKNFNLYELIKSEFNEGVYVIDLSYKTKSAEYFTVEDIDFIKEFKRPKLNVNYTFTHPQIGSVNISQFKLINYSEFKPKINEQYLDSATFEDFEELVGKKIIEKIEKKLPKIIFWEYKEEYLLPPEIPIDTFQTNPNSCIPLKNLFLIANVPENKISEYISNARNNFNTLRSRFDKVSKAATKFFIKAWPEYRGIKFELYPLETKIICGIKERNIWNFKIRSDGFKRFVSLLLSLAIPAEKRLLNNALILIDEADTSLHPSGARYLMEQLKKIAKNNYVVYATHSIFMIDRENIKRHYIVEKEKEITKIQEATEETYRDEEVLFKALGASVYEVLNEKNILFEGWTDKKLFEVFIARDKKNKKFFKKVGISHAIGVKSIKNILPILEMGNRKCLIITDGDSPAKEQQIEHMRNRGWGLWKRYDEIFKRRKILTAEDFIKKEVLCNALKQILRRENINLEIDDFNLPDYGRLSYIKNKLKESCMESYKVNEIVNKKLKEEIFHNLKYSEIEKYYDEFVKNVKKEIEKL